MLIFGAGLSGLTAARALQASGQTPIVLERSLSAGGLSRTLFLGDFCFDYTGHFLHLAHYASPADIPFAQQNNASWRMVNRRSFCWVANSLVPAPLQYNLAKLPRLALEQAKASYEARPREGAEGSFRDYIVSGFGQYIADCFLIPQNEKTLAIRLDDLSPAAVRRFFPAPDHERILAGLGRGEIAAEGYNASFWYPKTGGIELLINGLAAQVKDLRLGESVAAIDLPARLVRTWNGHIYNWNRAYSSIPLRDICMMSGDAELTRLGALLSHSTTISFSFGLDAPPQGPVASAHWVYVPDRDIPFYRVGWYSNISNRVCPPEHGSLYVEVGLGSDKLSTTNLAELQQRVIASLEALGWMDSRSLRCSAVNVLRCAYVHHTHSRNKTVEEILRRLHEHGIFPIGRYGLWDYTSMEDCIYSTIETVKITA